MYSSQYDDNDNDQAPKKVYATWNQAHIDNTFGSLKSYVQQDLDSLQMIHDRLTPEELKDKLMVLTTKAYQKERDAYQKELEEKQKQREAELETQSQKLRALEEKYTNLYSEGSQTHPSVTAKQEDDTEKMLEEHVKEFPFHEVDLKIYRIAKRLDLKPDHTRGSKKVYSNDSMKQILKQLEAEEGSHYVMKSVFNNDNTVRENAVQYLNNN